MMKKIICFVLLSVLFVGSAFSMASAAVIEQNSTTNDPSTVTVIQQRLRDLGYLNYRPTGKYSDMTVSAVRKFQQQNGIDPDGQVGEDTYNALFADTAKRAAINPSVKKVSGPGYSGQVTTKGELSSWETIDPLIPVGSSFTVTDFNSGARFTMQRVGGTHCAQVTAVSSSDYDAYLTAFGGDYTWEHRTVLVSIGDTDYAASLFGMPDASGDAAGSGMPGAATLYFNNSRTDVFSLSDEEHNIALNRAAGG